MSEMAVTSLVPYYNKIKERHSQTALLTINSYINYPGKFHFIVNNYYFHDVGRDLNVKEYRW